MNEEIKKSEPICITLMSAGIILGIVLGVTINSVSIGIPMGITVAFLSGITYKRCIGC